MTENALLLIAPLMGIVYAVGEYFRIWDKLTGRDKAIEGLNRLRSAAGYPTTTIYADPQDEVIFEALYKRIKKHTISPKLRAALQSGRKPSLIATLGKPIPIEGLPILPQEARFFFSENHPVVVGFGAHRGVVDEQRDAYIACRLRDLDDWLKEEENKRKFYIGTLMVTFLSIILIFLRACTAGKP